MHMHDIVNTDGSHNLGVLPNSCMKSFCQTLNTGGLKVRDCIKSALTATLCFCVRRINALSLVEIILYVKEDIEGALYCL